MSSFRFNCFNRSGPFSLAVMLALQAAVLTVPAGAALADDNTAAADPLDSKYMTGGWGGLRGRLQDAGITPRADISSELMSVVSGGTQSGTRYSQQVRVGADFDMSKLADWNDGRVHLTINDRRGRGTSSELAGNRFPIQENYGGQYTRLTEASFDQNVLDKRFNYKLGYFAMGNDFAMTQLLTNFVNAAFCAHPLALAANSGWYNYPNARWGAELTTHITSDVLVRTGAFEVNPRLGTKAHAFSPFADGSTGTLLPVEAAYEPGANTAYYKIGYYRDNSDTTELGSTTRASYRQGAYIMLDQKITTVEGDDSRGLSLFAQYMQSDRTTSAMANWFSVGAVYQGLIPARPKDTLAFGYVQAEVNEKLLSNAQLKAAAQGLDTNLTPAEKLYELSYGIQVNDWAVVRPDVQYIVDPGSFTYKHIRDVVAVGVQAKVTF